MCFCYLVYNKKLVKSIIIVAATFGFLTSVFFAYTTSTVRQVNACLVELGDTRVENMSKVLVPSPEQKKKILCAYEEKNLNTFSNCIQQAKEENSIKYTLVTSLPNIKKTFRSVFEIQNNQCPNNRVELVL